MTVTTTRPEPAGAERFALLSIAAALLTIGMKTAAWAVTGSVGLLSDAVESVANLLTALVAFWALRVAVRPPDEEHHFGHSKAEYLASAFEGLAIFGAAIAIALAAWKRIADPQPIENVGLGLAISCAAAAVNGGVAMVLMRAGRRLESITLRSDAHHLLTDVWTSAGVLVGIALVKVTGWLILDPLVALAVATNIVWMAAKILLETSHGLLDRTIPAAERETLEAILARYRSAEVGVHAVRTRASGPVRFIDMHVLVPGAWSVQRGHDLCEEIERAVSAAFPRASVLTHLEPSEDPASWDGHVAPGAPA